MTRLCMYEEEKRLMVMFCQCLAIVTMCVWTYFTYSSFLPSYFGQRLSQDFDMVIAK